jgi:predicted negative regulator of RcsB-dependent stress response
MKSRILALTVLVVLVIAGFAGWQLWQMHARNQETAQQFYDIANKMGRSTAPARH